MTIGPYMFDLTLTFTEIKLKQCSQLSPKISNYFLELFFMPKILRPYHQTIEEETFFVRPLVSKRAKGDKWLYDYHLFITTTPKNLCIDVTTDTDDLMQHSSARLQSTVTAASQNIPVQNMPSQNPSVQNNSVENDPSQNTATSDEFDLTISDSQENRIDSEYWSKKLNFGNQTATHNTLRSQVSRLQCLGLSVYPINFNNDTSEELADLNEQLRNHKRAKLTVSNSAGNGSVTHTTTPQLPSLTEVFSDRITSSGHVMATVPQPTDFSIGMSALVGNTLPEPTSDSQSQSNGEVDTTSEPNEEDMECLQQEVNDRVTLNNSSQETQLGTLEPLSSQEETDNTQLMKENSIDSPTKMQQERSVDEDSQNSSVYFESAESPVKARPHSSSVSDAEFKSPLNSPDRQIPSYFTASQDYKSSLFNYVAGSLTCPDLSLLERSDER